MTVEDRPVQDHPGQERPVQGRNRLSGPLADPAGEAGYAAGHPERVGFFTDTSICIGCKACEVACKTWNAVPEDGLDMLGMSFDNTGSLGANSWRHVAFIEQPRTTGRQDPGLAGLPTGPSGTNLMQEAVEPLLRSAPRGGSGLGTEPLSTAHDHDAPAVAARSQELGMPAFTKPGEGTGAEGRTAFRWLMASDVCKHCTHAGCLDVCPTGALFRTEFGTVVVQQDICNGCGYCVSGCPYGVIDRRPHDGRAQKCTLCYDRLRDGMEPACAQACPTKSIQFGVLDELRERADRRVEQLHGLGVTEARLYGHDPNDGVGGDGAFFLLLDEPEVYGLPPDPVVPTRNAPAMWRRAGAAAAAFLLAGVGAFASSAIGGRR
jgi:formate dehydrogenase iron-sulfur subunit